jgi:ABC-type dipeptide/oligopeptide/nickel transport system permease subunit
MGAVVSSVASVSAAPRTGAVVVAAGRALLKGERVGAVALCWLVIIVLVAVLAPVIAPYDPVHITSDTLAHPSLRHPFGTDQFGRDMLSRLIWGGGRRFWPRWQASPSRRRPAFPWGWWRATRPAG